MHRFLFFLASLVVFSFSSASMAASSLDDRLEAIKKKLPDSFNALGPDALEHVLKVMDHELRASDSPTISQGRLTLSSGVPVTTADVTGSTTVYFTPYNGNKIALYSGTNWQLFNFSELTVAVPGNTLRPFDIFAYNNGGTVALEAVAWADATTRATALTTQDGVYVKSGATTRRFLGTGATTSVSGQTEDSQAKRLLWNNHNRVLKTLYKVEATTSWAYTLQSWRQANGTASNQVELVRGLNEDLVNIRIEIDSRSTGASVTRLVGVGLDSVTVAQDGAAGYPNNLMSLAGIPAATVSYITSATYSGFPTAGYHYLTWLEYSLASGTTTWFAGSREGMQGFTYQ